VPTYYFNLHTPGGIFLDADGTELANDVQAEQHAKAVALELMCSRNAKTRSWRLETSDSGLECTPVVRHGNWGQRLPGIFGMSE
jgi:hypothetical protein